MIQNFQIMKDLMIVLLTIVTFQMIAQDINGDWNGKLSYQGTELRLVLHITGQNGKYQSTMDSPDQGASGIEIENTTFENGKLKIAASLLQMEYTAELDEKGATLQGTFIQQGVSIPLIMTKEEGEQNVLPPPEGEANNIVLGDWNGVLNISGTKLRLVFHIIDSFGILKSTMDSPDQNANGILMDKTTFENGKLRIVANTLNAEYTAELNDGSDTLNGIFEQNGRSWDLDMTREKVEMETVVRPQEPKDFPYYQEEVKFKNPKGGHRLAGTLTMPNDGNFEKVVILISGSGPQDRNEEILNHKPFLVLSDHFTRQGIAILRYDDRGIAASEGVFAEATSKDFADDAAAAVAYLKSRKDMEGKAIGLAGHSEGGMIASMVASENTAVEFIVLLAGPGIDLKELLLLQQERTGEAEGIPVSTRKTMTKIAREMFEYIEANINLDKDQLNSGLAQLLGNLYEKLSDDGKQVIGNKDDFINQQTRMATTDWYLYLIRFSPDRFLSKVKCPVLAVNGELDLQVTSKENLEGIRKSLKRAKNKNVTIHEFPSLNHLFQKTKTGAPSEYETLEETFNKEAMDYVSNWILALEI